MATVYPASSLTPISTPTSRREVCDECGAGMSLQRLAAESGYDLLVVGTRGKGVSKLLLGSTAVSLAAHAKVPVLLAGGGSTSA